MLLLLSKRSNFFLLSRISGEVDLQYRAGKACLAKPVCLRAHEAIGAFILQIFGRNIINVGGLLR